MYPTETSETIIALDLGGTKMLGVLINRDGSILTRLLAPTPRGNSAVLQAILNLIGQLNEKANILNIQPYAIAIGIPGVVDSQNGIAVDAENLDVLGLEISVPVSEAFHLPAFLYHDVRSAVLGEALYGAGMGHLNFGFLNIGTGIAIGLYLNGNVYHGATHQAGEIGHICLDSAAHNGQHGIVNFLESFASGPAIVRRAKDGLLAHPSSAIQHFAGENLAELTPLSIQKAALTGDTLASRLLQETAERLGAALGIVQDILDLECIILGGGVAQMGAVLVEPVQAALARFAIQPIPVLVTPLGSDVGVMGVGATYFQKERG